MSSLKAFYVPFSVIPRRTMKTLAIYFDEIYISVDDSGIDAHCDIYEKVMRDNGIDVLPDIDGVLGREALTFGELGSYLAGRHALRRFLAETHELQDAGLLKVEREIFFYGRGADPELPFSIASLWQEANTYQGFDGMKDLFLALSNNFWAGSALQSILGRHEGNISLTDLPGSQLALVCSLAFERRAELVTDVVEVGDYIRLRQAAQVTPSRAREIASNFAVTALERLLPNFERVPFSDILEIRIGLRDELLAFRSYVNDFAATMKLVEMPKDIEYEANKFHAKIDKTIRDLERSISRSRKKLFRKLAAGLAAASPPSLLTSVYPGLPLGVMAAISGGMALGTVYNAVSEHREQGEQERSKSEVNGLSFLLRFKDRAGGHQQDESTPSQ